MYKNTFASLLILMLIVGCKEEVKQIESKIEVKDDIEASFKRVFSDGDYNFQVEYNNRLDTSYFDVVNKGKKVNRFGFAGRIKNEYLIDLNSDKKNEVYIVVADKSIEKLYGFHIDSEEVKVIKKKSFKDNSKIISTSYKFIRGQLVENYGIQAEDGKVEIRTSRYNLLKNDDVFALLPQGWHPTQLEKMSGQYAARDATGAGYYKVMLLKDNGGGAWNVDIKVKRNNDKAIICDYSGVGYFLDQNLIVPLNGSNPKLKGSLKIRFLDLFAVVYTEDPEDSDEMVAFCKDVGSIAGNFKKTSI